MSNLEAEERKDTLVQHQGGGTVLKRLISLLAVATAFVLLAVPGFAQSSYTWQIDCNAVASGPGVGTGASWVWLHNGVQISLTEAGSAACVSTPLSGSGVIPESINGIQVNGIAVSLVLDEFPAGCDAFASVTKSFDPSKPKFSITQNVSAPNNSSFNKESKCPAGSFHFSLTAP